MRAPFPDLVPRQPVPTATEIHALLSRKRSEPVTIQLTPRERAAFEAFRTRMRAKTARENVFQAGDPMTQTWMP